MSGSIGTAYFNVAPNMTGVQGKISGGLKGSGSAFAEQFGGEVSGKSAFIIGAIAGIASAATTKAMSILSDSIGTAVKRVDTLNAAQKTFQYMGFAADDSAAAVKAVTKSIQGLPTPLDSAVRGMTSLAATYSDVKLGQKVFTALNDAVLGFGGSAAMVDNAIQQISQLPLDGPLDAQTWNSLRNSGLTPVLVAMGKDMGKSVSQLKEDFGSGKLTVQDFVNELTKLDTQGGGGLVRLSDIAHNATSGIATGFDNMKTAISRGMANIIQSIGQKNISSAIAGIGTAFEFALTGISKFFTLINKGGYVMPILIGAFSAFAVAVVASMIASSAAVATFTASVVAATIAAAPFIAIGAAIGLAALVIVKNWGKIEPILHGAKVLFELFFDLLKGGNPALKDSAERMGGVTKVLSILADVLRPVVSFVGTQLKNAFASIVSIGKQAGEALKPLIEAMQNILANKTVQTVLKVIGATLLAIAAGPIIAFFATMIVSITLFSKLLGFLADHFTVVKVIAAVIFAPFIASIAIVILSVKAIIAAVKILITVFTTVFNVIKTVVVGTFNAIAAVWNAVLSPVLNVMITIIKTIFSIYTKVWAAIALVVVGTMFIIGGIIANVMQAIWGVISSVWNAIYGVISSVMGIITGIIVNNWNFYYGIVSSVLNMIWGVITTVWNAIYGFLSGVFSAIGSVVAGAWNRVYSTVAGVVGNIWNAVTGTFNAVVNFMGGIGGRILGVLGNLGGLLYNSGRAMIQGLLNGAGSLLSSIGQFFLDKLPGWIQGPFKKALGIRSPSRVFAGYGANITQGLANGIENTSSTVTKAVGNLADAALGGFGGAGITSDVAASMAPSSPYSAVGPTGDVTNQDVTIGQVVLGDQSAAKEFFKQLNQDTINVGMGLTPNQGAI